MSLYTMKLSDSVDTMEFNLLEVPIQDKDIEGAVDNVVLSGDIYTDFLWLKKRFTHKWSILCKDDYERLRGFYTRQFSNAEVPIYQLLDAPSPVEESAGSGEYIQITTTDSTAKLASVEMLGKAEQTTYSGKNLMPLEPYRFGYYYSESVGNQINYDVTSSAHLVTFTPRADSTSTMTVTASWRGTWFMSQALTAGTYYLNLNGATTTGNLGASVYAMDSDHKITRQILNTTAAPITNQLQMAITLAEGETYISVGIGVRTTPGTITLGTLMLSAGSTATAYEPYVGGTPAPNPEFPQPISVVTGENVVKIEGKNLYNNDLPLDNKYLDASGNWVASTYSYINQEFSVQPSTACTWSASSKTGAPNLRFGEFDASGAFIRRTMITATNQSITTTATTASVKLSADGTPQNKFNEPQLELGSTATAYEPYQGQEFEVNLGSIELAKIGTYQDRIYKSGGKWYVHKEVGKVVFDGSETWTAGQGGTLRLFYSAQYADVLLTNQRQNFLSNNFHFIASGNETGAGFIYQQRFYLYYGDMDTDANAFKTWLGTHNTTVYYALATPTTTEITNEALIAQLDALGASSLYLGVNNIGTETQNATPTLALTYFPYYPHEIISPKAVRMELTDGGIINACECRENVQITLRETIQ